MLNIIWVFMILIALAFGAINGTMAEVSKASTDSAQSAVTLALGLVGVMAFWLGMMKVLEAAGALRFIARALRPLMRRLFPEVPEDHPAMSMMIMNMSSNMLGLGNAATPFGLKAMKELKKLSPVEGEASNAMALFLAINTSSIALLPTGMIAVRASLGSKAPGSIMVPTLIATFTSTLVAICVAKSLARFWPSSRPPAERSPGATKQEHVLAPPPQMSEEPEQNLAHLRTSKQNSETSLLWILGALCCAGVVLAMGLGIVEGANKIGWLGKDGQLLQLSSHWVLPFLIFFILCVGWIRNVKIYDAVVEGGREAFDLALRIIPFLVAMLVAVGMLRASGAIDQMVALLNPLTSLVGMPGEALPMAILRPLSGGGAYGLCAEIMQSSGPDSLVGMIVSTMQGSTETTFYVLAVYYGAAGVTRSRHTLIACLCADAAGVLAAVTAVNLWIG